MGLTFAPDSITIIPSKNGRAVLDDMIELTTDKYKTREEFEAARPEIYELLARSLYGEMPQRPDHLSVDVKSVESGAFGGKAKLTHFRVIVDYGEYSFSFPATSLVPCGGGRYPTFIYLRGEEEVPTEEIIDGGFALIVVRAEDVTADNGDMRSGCARWLTRGRWRLGRPGKIAIWAWALTRLADYALASDYVDTTRLALIGHAHLGAAALLAGGCDQRIGYIISNEAGLGGDALSLDNERGALSTLIAEHPERYTRAAMADRGTRADARHLLSLCVPRHIMIGGAADDAICRVDGQIGALDKLRGLYEVYGMDGIPSLDYKAIPYRAETSSVSYHIRRGTSFLTREDWKIYMEYIKL